jgi:hypothetical protein
MRDEPPPPAYAITELIGGDLVARFKGEAQLAVTAAADAFQGTYQIRGGSVTLTALGVPLVPHTPAFGYVGDTSGCNVMTDGSDGPGIDDRKYLAVDKSDGPITPDVDCTYQLLDAELGSGEVDINFVSKCPASGVWNFEFGGGCPCQGAACPDVEE